MAKWTIREYPKRHSWYLSDSGDTFFHWVRCFLILNARNKKTELADGWKEGVNQINGHCYDHGYKRSKVIEINIIYSNYFDYCLDIIAPRTSFNPWCCCIQLTWYHYFSLKYVIQIVLAFPLNVSYELPRVRKQIFADAWLLKYRNFAVSPRKGSFDYLIHYHTSN